MCIRDRKQVVSFGRDLLPFRQESVGKGPALSRWVGRPCRGQSLAGPGVELSQATRGDEVLFDPSLPGGHGCFVFRNELVASLAMIRTAIGAQVVVGDTCAVNERVQVAT